MLYYVPPKRTKTTRARASIGIVCGWLLPQAVKSREKPRNEKIFFAVRATGPPVAYYRRKVVVLHRSEGAAHSQASSEMAAWRFGSSP